MYFVSKRLAVCTRSICVYLLRMLAERIPALQMLTAASETLEKRARILSERFDTVLKTDASVGVEPCEGRVGGGAMPETRLASFAVRVAPTKGSATSIDERLRAGSPAIVCRLDHDALVFDVRTLLDEQIDVLVDRVAHEILA